MGDLTRGEYRARVRRALGNLSAADPIFADGQDISAINNAPNRLIRDYPDRFPEHQNRTWTHGPLTVGSNRVTNNYVPSNLFLLEGVSRNASATDPDDWATVEEIPVTILSGDADKTLGQLDKDTEGYPSLICRKDGDLMYWPVTTADYVCWLRLYGTSRELALTADDQSFRMDRDYDSLIVMLAAEEIAAMTPGMGWRATELRESITLLLGGSGVMTREAAKRPLIVNFAGWPGMR